MKRRPNRAKKILMKTKITTISALLGVALVSSASAALIAGADFSDSAVFNAAGGANDNSATSVDDLDAGDGVTVSGWSFVNGGSLADLDANAQVGMPGGTDPHVTKFNGNGQAQPILGASASAAGTHSFSINVPAGFVVNLESVSFDWRQATGTASQVRWLAFDTSADSGVIFSEVGAIRNAFESDTVDLSGASYQGLGGTVTFNFYAGGTGSGDIDIDTIVVNGSVAAVPEPSGVALLGLGALAFLKRRRR